MGQVKKKKKDLMHITTQKYTENATHWFGYSSPTCLFQIG